MQPAALPDEPEALVRFLFDLSPVPMVISKFADGTILNVNQAFADAIGASPESLLGRKGADFFANPDDRSRVLKTMNEQGHGRAEVQIRDCHGNLRWVVIDAKITEQNGEQILFTGWTDITQSKRAEESLCTGEERYREMIEGQGEGIVIADLSEAILFANPAADEIFGVVRGTLIGRLISEFMSEPEKQALQAQTENRKKGERSSYEIEIRRPNGAIRHVLVTATPRRNKIGQVVGTFGVFRDITERKQAEAALKENEENFRLMFDQAPLSYQSLDEHGCFLDVNSTWLHAVGYEREEIIGKWFGDFLAEPGPALFRQRFPMFKEIGEVHGVEFTMRRKDGTLMDVSFDGKVAHHLDGRFKQTHCIFADITESKQAETALKESESRYRSLFEHMPAGYAFCEMLYDERHQPVDWIYLEVNPAFERSTGLKDAAGKKVSELIPGIRETNPEVFEIYNRVAETGQPERFEIDLTLLNLELDVSVFSPARGFFVATFEDITERRRATKRLAQLNQVFLSFGTDPVENINRLTALAGEITSATCALYNRLEDGMLHSIGQWQTPPDFCPTDKPEGHLCHDVIQRGGEDVFVVRDLQHTTYAQTDPNVSRYQLQTYIGVPVICAQNVVGSLCVAYQRDYEPTEDDQKVLGIISSAVAVEEARRGEETALRESEERYRLLADHSGDVIWRLNLDTLRFTYMSPSAFALTGFKPEEIMAMSLEDMMTPESYLKIVEEIPRRMAECASGDPSAHVRTYEVELLCKNGTTVPVEVVTTLVKDETSGVIYVTGSSRNIVERKRALEALQNSEQMLSSIFSNVSVVLFSLSVEPEERFRFLSVNQPFLNATGLSETAVVGKYVEEVIPEPSLTLVLEKYREALRNKATVRWEEVTDYPAGRKFGDVAVTPILDADGRCTMLIGSVHDVTERKRAENALRVSEERFRQVAESAGEWIWEVNAEGLYTYASPVAEKIIGYRPDELVGKKHFYDLFAPDVREELKAAAISAFAQRLSIQGFVNPNIHKNGKIVILETNGLPIVDEQGNFLGYRGADLDITERTRVEQAAKEAYDQLEATLRAIPDLMFELDAEGVICGYRAPEHGFLYVPPSEFLGKRVGDVLPESAAAVISQALADCAKQGWHSGAMYALDMPDGQHWYELSIAQKRERADNGDRFVALAHDITERKRAENVLRTSQAHLSNALRIAKLGPWEYDFVKDVFTFSDEFYAIFRTTAEQVGGYTMPSARYAELFVHPEDMAMVGEEIRKSIETTDPNYCAELEHRIVYADGEIGHIAVRFQIVKDSEGRTVGSHGMNQDITERKQTEEVLRRRNEYLTALQETTLDLLAEHDLDSLLETILKRAGELVGTTTGWLDLLEPGANHLTPKIALGALATESRKFAVERGEGLSGRVWQSRQPIAIEDYDAWPGRIPDHGRNLIRSIVAVPLLSGSEILGVLGLAYERGTNRTFDETAINLLGQFARMAVLAVENARLFSTARTELAERQRAEQTLRESESHLRTVVESLSEGLVITDLEGVILYVNHQMADMCGYKTEELLGAASDMIVPESSQEIIRTKTKSRALGAWEKYETQLMCKDGSLFWVEISASPYPNAEGTVIGALAAMRDITDRKRAEEALKRSEAELRLRDEINHVLLTISDDGMYREVLRVVQRELESVYGLFGYIDSTGSLVLASMTDAVWEECQMPNKTWVFPEKQWGGTWGRALRERKTLWANEGHHTPEGHVPITKSIMVPILQQGQLVGLLGVANKASDYEEADVRLLESIADRVAPLLCARLERDIKEQERLHAAEERISLESQLRQSQKLETIGTLAGGIAHDFNNILTPILAYSQMAASVLEQEHPMRANIEEVVNSANRAKELVKQILTFSRQSEQQRFPMDPAPIIKEALKLMRASIPSTIEIRQDIDTKCGAILADPSQIHQVLMNLCTNAYHAMQDHGGVLTVALKPCTVDDELSRTHPNLTPGEYVHLTVADTGSGIDAQTLERIFEPFFTTKQVGEGTGLGLSVVHGIVTKYEGAITVRSEPGNGTTFDVYLPRVHSKQLKPIQDEIPVVGGHEHILVIDDEPIVAETTKNVLERLGYTITVRTSSLEALELFRQDPNRFDLVITDQTMPHLTGDRLAKELIAARVDIPIILMTGFSQTMDEERCQKLGIDRFLMKPLLPTELARAVRSVLGTSELSS
jgi:PAS domain S-box-containing protein